MYKKLMSILQMYIHRIKDVFTPAPIPDFSTEIKNTWGDYGIIGDTNIEEYPIPFDDVVLKILCVHSNEVSLDGNEVYSFSAKGVAKYSDNIFYFHTNFDKKLLNDYIRTIKEVGLPKGSVGISEIAYTQYGTVSNHAYGLYLARNIIPEDLYIEFDDKILSFHRELVK